LKNFQTKFKFIFPNLNFKASKNKTMGKLDLKLPYLIAIIAGGLGVILLIGLLTGLVARPKNCVKSGE